MLEVCGDAQVRVQQVVGALVVRHPALVEEDMAAGQPELATELLGLPGDPHVRHAGVRVLEPHEEQAHVGVAVLEPVDRADQGQRVEPVVDTAAPQDDLVVGPDALDGSP